MTGIKAIPPNKPEVDRMTVEDARDWMDAWAERWNNPPLPKPKGLPGRHRYEQR